MSDSISWQGHRLSSSSLHIIRLAVPGDGSIIGLNTVKRLPL
jgi:hypothetical protein